VRALLDTHAFLWWTVDDPRLSQDARTLIEDASNELYLSVASAWELAIKVGLGRVETPAPIDEFLPDSLARNGVQALAIELPHALRVARLPSIHGDPFDRLIVAQAQIEGLPILTADPAIDRYDVDTIW
jgi:PIN domain nuclease of toxin-antitoxin system